MGLEGHLREYRSKTINDGAKAIITLKLTNKGTKTKSVVLIYNLSKRRVVLLAVHHIGLHTSNCCSNSSKHVGTIIILDHAAYNDKS